MIFVVGQRSEYGNVRRVEVVNSITGALAPGTSTVPADLKVGKLLGVIVTTNITEDTKYITKVNMDITHMTNGGLWPVAFRNRASCCRCPVTGRLPRRQSGCRPQPRDTAASQGGFAASHG